MVHLGFCGIYHKSEWPAVTQLFKSLLISSWSSRVSSVWENMPSVSCVPRYVAPPLTTSVFSPSVDAKPEYFMSCRSAKLSLTVLQDYLFSLPAHTPCVPGEPLTTLPGSVRTLPYLGPGWVRVPISVPWPVHLFMCVWSVVFLVCLPLRAGTLPAQLGTIGSCMRLSSGGLKCLFRNWRTLKVTSAEPGLWEEPSKKIFLILPLNSWSTWVKPITSLGLKFFMRKNS